MEALNSFLTVDLTKRNTSSNAHITHTASRGFYYSFASGLSIASSGTLSIRLASSRTSAGIGEDRSLLWSYPTSTAVPDPTYFFSLQDRSGV